MPNTAQTYFKSFSKAAQDQIKASWGGEDLMGEWFQNAQAAGAVGPEGGGGGATSGGGENSGKVTPDDVRANAKKYNLPEDFARFNDAQIMGMLRTNKYDPSTGKFTNDYGDKVDKPDERGPNTPHNMNGTGDRGDYGWGADDSGIGVEGGKGGGGGGGGKPAAPAQPTTFGKQLSYTGDPMTDMLLYQFNETSRSAESGGGQNIMGLGEDMQAGGEGANEDKGGVAQLLKGGGLWRAMSKDAFGGFRADETNVTDPKTGKKKRKRGRGRGGSSPTPTPEEIAAPPGTTPEPTPTGPTIPEYKSDVLYGGNKNNMRDMMKNRYGSNFGGTSYL